MDVQMGWMRFLFLGDVGQQMDLDVQAEELRVLRVRLTRGDAFLKRLTSNSTSCARSTSSSSLQWQDWFVA